MPTPDPIPLAQLENVLNAIELATLNTHMTATMNPRSPYLLGARDTFAAIRLALGLPNYEPYPPQVVIHTVQP